MHRLRPVFAVAVCALFLQFGDAKSVPPQSSATQQESEGPEKIPPEDVNRPKQIIGMETTSSFKESIVDLAAEPTAKLLLENDSVRVYRIDLPPKETLQMHWHKSDAMVFHLGEFQVNEFIIEPASRDLQKVDLTLYKRMRSASDLPIPTAISSGTLHMITETAWKGYRGIEVELKHNGGSGHVQMQPLVPGQTVRIDSMAKQKHLLVALDGQELSDTVEGEPAITLKQDIGDVKWYAGGKSHTFTNAGKKSVMLILIPCR